MDNRTNVIEDAQSTPEHPGAAGQASVATQEQGASQLSAGPHNDPPKSKGIEDTYQAPPSTQGASAWQSVQRTVARYPLPIALSAAGLGVTMVLLARRRARTR